METTKNELPKKIKKFFYELSEYLDTKLLYYGSIQRSDYFPGKSDIDIVIFTHNEYSIINKMQHFLHLPKDKFERFILISNNITTYGYKLKYKKMYNNENILLEFSIYNEIFKNNILKNNNDFDLPIYVTCFFYILKFLFYTLKIIDSETFIYFKRIIWNVNGKNDKFLILDSNKEKKSFK